MAAGSLARVVPYLKVPLMKRLLLAAALAVSAAAAPAAVASTGVEAWCNGEQCVAVSSCDIAAEGCERPPWPYPPPADCTWVQHGNLWYVICW